MKAIARFKVTGWDEEPWALQSAEADDDAATEGPHLSAVRVRKEYEGDLEGVGHARLLMCRAHREGPLRNAGYIVSEKFRGRLAGRAGGFVLHHWGVAPEASPPWTAGHVVPGSGTGDLAGLLGSMEIRVDDDGTHTLVLEYEIGGRIE